MIGRTELNVARKSFKNSRNEKKMQFIYWLNKSLYRPEWEVLNDPHDAKILLKLRNFS